MSARGWRVVGAGLFLATALAGGFRWWRTVEVPPLGRSASALLPGVWYLAGLDPSAAYVVETSQGLVLVDSGLDEDAGRLRSEMASLGLDWRRIRAVLLTHAHGDHTGGANFLRTELNARIHAGKGDAAVLRAGGPREAFFSTFHMPEHTTHPTPVDVELSGGERLTFGDTQIQAVATPGHTPGSICYLLERRGLRLLFAGDVVTMLLGDGNPHPMGLRPLGTYSAYLSPRYRGDARTYLDSLEALQALDAPDLVLPGHPRSDPSPQSPRIGRRRWEEILDQGIRDLKILIGRYDADGRDFLDGEPKRLLPNVYYLGDHQGAAVYGFDAGDTFTLIDAPGGPGLVDFVAARRQRLGLSPASPSTVLLTSCNPKETAGLEEVVARSQPRVVTSRAGVNAVRALVPPATVVVVAEDLPRAEGAGPSAIRLRGRGLAPVAYVLRQDGKTVLFSGRIPILFDHASTEALRSELARSRADAIEYLDSLTRLEGVAPDLWLPAVPSDDQNANIYDDQWKYVIENNYRAGYAVLEHLEGRR